MAQAGFERCIQTRGRTGWGLSGAYRRECSDEREEWKEYLLVVLRLEEERVEQEDDKLAQRRAIGDE